MPRVFVSNSRSDLSRVAPILRAFGAECGLADRWGQLEESIFETHWGSLLDIKAAFFVLLEDDAGEVVGAMGGLIAPTTFWDKLSLNEVFWYVLPDHRRGTGPIRMLKVAEEEGKRRGCSLVFAGHKVFWNAEKMTRLYTALKYTPHDLIYVKEI